uniref:Uncharacterized protein n=1 Tax=viral metagenome TaxID=1070528 RepID=A0A6M3KDC1_9ZZZZ
MQKTVWNFCNENGLDRFLTDEEPDREEKPTRKLKPIKEEDDAFLYEMSKYAKDEGYW